MAAPVLPPWLSNSYNSTNTNDPSVTLSLSSPTIPPPPPPSAKGSSWLVQQERADTTTVASVDGAMVSEITDCCRELEEGYQAWMANKKETTWRLQRVELQLESEKTKKRKEKMEEVESKIRALKEEERMALESIETEYKEQIFLLRKDAQIKEQKLADQFGSKHMRLIRFLDQMAGGGSDSRYRQM